MKTSLFLFALLVCSAPALGADDAKAPKKSAPSKKQIERGEYLVKTGGCGDCHTPKTMTKEGPAEDHSRMLSGHPAGEQLPAPPKAGNSPWVVTTTMGLTAWSGPWGISYARNLTPDKATGLGEWTEQQFVDTIKTGKRMGVGPVLLPPMPWPAIKNLTDEDLKAIFAYLQSIPPVKNMVPDAQRAPPPKS
jgi:mono/diheme cytochrome c family protein